MRFTITHRLSIDLGEGAHRAIQHLLLTPQNSSVQTVKEWQIEAPGMDDAVGFIDAYGNRAHLSSQTWPEPELTVVARGVVETHDRSGVVGRLDRDPVTALFRRVTPLTKPVGAIVSKFRGAPRDGQDRIPLLHAVMARVGEVLQGEGQSQSQSADGQAQSQNGQNQAEVAPPQPADFAHAFIGAVRALGIPARYVIGYLGPGDEFAPGFHAWAEAWDDALGWIGFDAMLNMCPAEHHVRLAAALDATSAMPLRSVPGVASPSGGDVVIEPAP